MDKKIITRIIAGSSLGTILEWYDFSLFAFLTPTISKLFFPQQNSFVALLSTYAVFAIGYFARPFGAILFGHIGDRIGRNKTLVWSILLMSLPTFCMGLMPSYQQIGIAAPILLILLRICQGISAGGETTGSIVFALESVTEKRRGVIGGLVWSMSGVGMLVGSFAAMTVAHFEHITWAWRIPFLFGIVTGFAGYFLRKHTLESIQFTQALMEHTIQKFPLIDGIKKYKSAMLKMIGLFILSAMITYLVFIFMPTFVATVIGLPLAETTKISTIAYLIVTLLVPVGGYLSDKVNRVACLKWAACGFMIFAFPMFYLISQNSLTNLILAEIVFVLLAAVYQGGLNAVMFNLVPTHVRYSVMAVCYSVSYSVFGGTAPFVATYLVHATGNEAAPGLYLTAGAMIAFFASTRLQKRAHITSRKIDVVTETI